MSSPSWDLFREWSRTLADLSGVMSLLSWDRETAMPAAGADARMRALSRMSTIYHRELVRDDAGDAIAELQQASLTDAEAREVELMARRRGRAVRVPEDLVRAHSEASSRSVTAWMAALPEDDWEAFRGPLATLVDRSREIAALLSDGGEPYDALLDDYEPGARASDLEPVFRDLQQRLAPIVARRRDDGPATPLPGGPWPAAAQMELAREVAEMVGYRLDEGAIATSTHPFTTNIGHRDVRFSTRRSLRDPVENVLIVLHEAGHAIYEQGLPDEWVGTALHEAASLGAHESQSRFWENHVGRTRAFWERCLPRLRHHFGQAAAPLTVDAIVAGANRVRPGLIRVDADEATYNLHVALRFDLELQLFRGTLQVADLPAAWDAAMERLLGVRPTRASQGAMQDIHWAEGLFGYFPTYTLGSLYAAQLAEMADRRVGGLDAAISDGRFDDILEVMRDAVHRRGAMVPTGQLMQEAIGAPLSADALVAHLS